jgi:hypothetical protein
MTTEIQVGRLGVDVDMVAPSVWSARGEDVTVGGTITASSVSEGTVLRDQVLGLAVGRDEPIVPVSCSWDATLDGYYELAGVEVEEGLMSPVDGSRRWRMSLRRLPGWQAPLIESVLHGALRTNSHSILTASTVPFLAVPAVAGEALDPGGAGTLTVGTRTAADGALDFLYGANSLLYGTVMSYYLPPASFYVGSPKVEVDVGSGTWRTVTGRLVRNSPTAVRISNGLVRFTFKATGSGYWCTSIEVYDGVSTWDTLTGAQTGTDVATLKPNLTTGGASLTMITDLKAVTVLRNSSCEAALRFTFGTSTPAVVFADVSLRRGDRLLRCRVSSPTLETEWGVKMDTYVGVSDMTALTGGLRSDDDDDAGNRIVLTSHNAFTDRSNVDSHLAFSKTVSAGAFGFGIGVELGGSGSSGQNTAQNLCYQFHAAQSERVFITGRG